MSNKSLQSFIEKLEHAGELIRIKEFVDPELEITEITDRFSKLDGGGKALSQQYLIVRGRCGQERFQAVLHLLPDYAVRGDRGRNDCGDNDKEE